jgi:hypothetical protein
VIEVNRRLAHHKTTKKTLARALEQKGLGISEMMVIRCLHEDPERRIPTVEAIAAISAAVGIPRPVFVARSIEQARELEAVIAFGELDAKALAIASGVGDDGGNGGDGKRVPEAEQDGAAQGRGPGRAATATMGGRGQRVEAARPQAVRRTPRTR